MNKSTKNRWSYGLLVLPVIIGTVGYYLTGKLSGEDSFYYALNLYGLNYLNGIPSNPLLQIAKWTAPIATATAILTVIKKAGLYLRNRAICLLQDSVVVYGESPVVESICKSKFNCVNETEGVLRSAKTHILLFDDLKNLRFFHAHKEEFKSKHEIYIALDQFPLEIFDEVEKSSELPKTGLTLKHKNVHLFSPNDIKAKNLWRRRDDIKRIIRQKVFKEEVRIALVGDCSLGQQVLWYGLQINLYSKDQKIVYEIYGDNPVFAARLSQFQTMNSDRVVWKERSMIKDLIEKPADIIIVTEEETADDILNIYRLCPNCEMYCYSNEDMKVKKWINKDMDIHYFGADAIDITLSSIREDELYRSAMDMNESYGKMEGSNYKEWESLNWFVRMSNIYSADYKEVFEDILDHEYKERSNEEREDIKKRLEHIRWCRFHFMNGWRYGAKRDNQKRIHDKLVEYDRLSVTDQNKDLR